MERSSPNPGSSKRTSNLDPSAHSFTNRFGQRQGRTQPLHEIWHNRVQAYNNTIQSGRSQLVPLSLPAPPKAVSGSFTLSATVKYRRFDQHFIDYAMDQPASKHFLQPVIDVASDSRTLRIGENVSTDESVKQSSGAQPRIRSGCAGIITASVSSMPFGTKHPFHAFERVAALRPDYARRLHQYGHRRNDRVGNATTTPSRIWKKLSDSFPAILAPSTIEPLSSATPVK